MTTINLVSQALNDAEGIFRAILAEVSDDGLTASTVQAAKRWLDDLPAVLDAEQESFFRLLAERQLETERAEAAEAMIMDARRLLAPRQRLGTHFVSDRVEITIGDFLALARALGIARPDEA